MQTSFHRQINIYIFLQHYGILNILFINAFRFLSYSIYNKTYLQAVSLKVTLK